MAHMSLRKVVRRPDWLLIRFYASLRGMLRNPRSLRGSDTRTFLVQGATYMKPRPLKVTGRG